MLQSFFSFLYKNYSSLHRFLATHRTYTAILFLVAVGILGLGLFSSPSENDDSYTVGYGAIKQSVAVSGSVQASKDATLSFQTGGQVAYIGARVGDRVTQGKVLSTLQAGNVQASLLEAEAVLANRQATLLQLENGARKEELAIKEQAVANAGESLTQAYYGLPDAIKNVDAVTADTVKNKFSSLFTFNGVQYTLSFSSCDQRLQNEVEVKRTKLEESLASFQKKSTTVSAISSNEALDEAFSMAYQSAVLTNELVNGISGLLLAPCSTTNASLDGYRTTLSSVKTSMTSLFSDLTAKRAVLVGAKNTLNQANRDLSLAKAGTDPYTLKAQSALVSQAEAQVAQARANLSKTIIVAPFTGVISEVDMSIGETVTTGHTVIQMMATEGYEIEAKVPEVDIIKVKVGASVDVTLDAYGTSVIFPATVTRINPSATTEGTVPVYKVIVTFSGTDERIKQGMTANVTILTESKSSVITIPARFVHVMDATHGQVVVVTKTAQEVKNVTLGIRGDAGLIEVTEGLVEGDVVVSQETVTRGAQKQTN
ncbi:MAG: hypothetical protein RLZZ308_73 [Candidatus Parcubacteria bacterium]|jgi:HlyD family secretion protein